MKGTKWWVATGVATVAVASTVAAGVYVNEVNQLTYQPAQTLAAPEREITGIDTATVAPVDNAALGARLAALAGDPRLGTLGAKVVDATTGELVFEVNPEVPLRPASSTKVLTAAAAMLKLGADDQITTNLYKQDNTTVVIKAAGDVWMDSARLDSLAEQVKQTMPEVSSVLIDITAWQAPAFAQGWDPIDIEGGYIAPMEPMMIHGARIGDTTGDVPRSSTPALDVAGALAARLGVETFGYTEYQVPEQPETSAPPTTTIAVDEDQPAAPAPEAIADGAVVASTQSPTLRERVTEMMENSDNVMAEAIGREIDGLDPTGATKAILEEAGFNLTGVNLLDNSGLSVDNLIPPALLTDIFTEAVNNEALRPIIGTLPVAGGTGTLFERYHDKAGRGWVRAKTGTLTETSALTGVVVSNSQHIYSFTLLSTDAPVLDQREAMDEFTSAIREF